MKIEKFFEINLDNVVKFDDFMGGKKE